MMRIHTFYCLLFCRFSPSLIFAFLRVAFGCKTERYRKLE